MKNSDASVGNAGASEAAFVGEGGNPNTKGTHVGETVRPQEGELSKLAGSLYVSSLLAQFKVLDAARKRINHKMGCLRVRMTEAMAASGLSYPFRCEYGLLRKRYKNEPCIRHRHYKRSLNPARGRSRHFIVKVAKP